MKRTTSSDSAVDESVRQQYELLCSRMLNEYEQRDRDFLMYVTINTGVLGALAFVLQSLAPRAGTLITCGILMFVLGGIGSFFARALAGSVRSFTYWQSLMTALLAKFELALLPVGTIGAYTHMVARHRLARERFCEIASPAEQALLPSVGGLSHDLVNYRLELGELAVKFWKCVVLIAGVLCGVGAFMLTPEGSRRLQVVIDILGK